MTFEESKRVIYSCKSLTFIAASDRLQEIVFALNKADTLEIISQIGAIPEDIGHDSTEDYKTTSPHAF